MAILTIIPSLNTVGNAFIGLLFPNQCLVCNEGEFYSQDPICLDCFQQMTPLPSGNRVQELTVNNGIYISLSGWNLGDELRKAVQKSVYTKLMKRVKYTISQTTLDRKERLKNMKKAFRINQDVTAKNIGIVDDVLTTGSTISSMASILKDAGAKKLLHLRWQHPLENKDDTYAESV